MFFPSSSSNFNTDFYELDFQDSCRGRKGDLQQYAILAAVVLVFFYLLNSPAFMDFANPGYISAKLSEKIMGEGPITVLSHSDKIKDLPSGCIVVVVAKWCGHCTAFKEEIKKTTPSGSTQKVAVVDVDNSSTDVLTENSVDSIPSPFIKNGDSLVKISIEDCKKMIASGGAPLSTFF
jgi:hypothetical protein